MHTDPIFPLTPFSLTPFSSDPIFLTIAAKNLATEMTNHNVQQSNLRGELPITRENVQNNTSVRQMLAQRGINRNTYRRRKISKNWNAG